MMGARILTMMLLFNFFVALLGFHSGNTLLNKFIIIDTQHDNVIMSDTLKNSLESDLMNSTSTVTTDFFSSVSTISLIWNVLMLLFSTLLAPFLIFGFGLPLVFSVPIFIVWFTAYLFAIISLIRGVSF